MQAKPDFTIPLSDTSAGLSQVGGKGASLARSESESGGSVAVRIGKWTA
jgi:hypothetical protein